MTALKGGDSASFAFWEQIGKLRRNRLAQLSFANGRFVFVVRTFHQRLAVNLLEETQTGATSVKCVVDATAFGLSIDGEIAQSLQRVELALFAFRTFRLHQSR